MAKCGFADGVQAAPVAALPPVNMLAKTHCVPHLKCSIKWLFAFKGVTPV